MTPNDVLKYFKSAYYFNKKTGMAHTSLYNWLRDGFIPLQSQKKISDLTNGKLKIDLTEPIDKDTFTSYIASRNDVIDEVINRLEDMKKEGL